MGIMLSVVIPFRDEAPSLETLYEELAAALPRESDVSGKIEEGVLAGLRELNTQVSHFVDSAESTEAAEAEAETEAEA